MTAHSAVLELFHGADKIDRANSLGAILLFANSFKKDLIDGEREAVSYY
jgi:hypothetical protein